MGGYFGQSLWLFGGRWQCQEYVGRKVSKAGIYGDGDNEQGAVSELLETADGLGYYCTTISPESVTVTKCELIETLSSRIFQDEC